MLLDEGMKKSNNYYDNRFLFKCDIDKYKYEASLSMRQNKKDINYQELTEDQFIAIIFLIIDTVFKILIRILILLYKKCL